MLSPREVENNGNLGPQEPQEPTDLNPLVRDFKQAIESFLGGANSRYMHLYDEVGERFRLRKKDGYFILQPASILYSENWSDPLGCGYPASATAGKGKDGSYAIIVKDVVGRGVLFTLSENNPSVYQLFPEDPRKAEMEDPRLQTPEQKLRFGIFLVSRLEQVCSVQANRRQRPPVIDFISV